MAQTRSEVFPGGYNVYRKGCSDDYGGAFLACHQSLISYELVKRDSSSELCACQINLPNNSKLIVCSVYRPPSSRLMSPPIHNIAFGWLRLIDSSCLQGH